MGTKSSKFKVDLSDIGPGSHSSSRFTQRRRLMAPAEVTIAFYSLLFYITHTHTHTPEEVRLCSVDSHDHGV
jgi:hypothetical protein